MNNNDFRNKYRLPDQPQNGNPRPQTGNQMGPQNGNSRPQTGNQMRPQNGNPRPQVGNPMRPQNGNPRPQAGNQMRPQNGNSRPQVGNPMGPAQRRNIKNKPKTIPKRFIATIAAAILAGTVAIGISNGIAEEYERRASSSQEEIFKEMQNNFTSNDIRFDENGNVIIDASCCPQRYVFQTLQNTELDEMINEYYKAKKDNDKVNEEKLERNLRSNKTELIKLNRDLLLALIADGSDRNPEDIRLECTFMGTAEERDLVSRGLTPSRGHYLRVGSLEAFRNNATNIFNYNEISSVAYNFISDIQLSYEAPAYRNQSLEEILDTHANLTQMINDGYKINIDNGKMEFLDKNNKVQKLSRNRFTGILEFQDKQEETELE